MIQFKFNEPKKQQDWASEPSLITQRDDIFADNTVSDLDFADSDVTYSTAALANSKSSVMIFFINNLTQPSRDSLLRRRLFRQKDNTIVLFLFHFFLQFISRLN